MLTKNRAFSYRLMMVLSLFLIGSLQAVVFGFVQYPQNFLATQDAIAPVFHKVSLIALYGTGVVAACFAQVLHRRIGLKRTLILAISCDILGLCCLFFEHLTSSETSYHVFLILGLIFVGAALAFVLTTLMTYIIMEFPQKSAAGITALYAFMNMGAMLAPILLDLFGSWYLGWPLIALLLVASIYGIFFVAILFVDPPLPDRPSHLRKGGLLWREVHRRLILFIIAMTFYGICENTFNLWGSVQLHSWIEMPIANTALSIFWLSLTIGQIMLLIPLYFLPVRWVFYSLMVMVVPALLCISHQYQLTGLVIALAVGGFGCSASSPILVALMEKDFFYIAKQQKNAPILPYLESGVSLMNAGYLLGVGLVAFAIPQEMPVSQDRIIFHFDFAASLALVIAILGCYLSITLPKRSRAF